MQQSIAKLQQKCCKLQQLLQKVLQNALQICNKFVAKSLQIQGGPSLLTFANLQQSIAKLQQTRKTLKKQLLQNCKKLLQNCNEVAYIQNYSCKIALQNCKFLLQNCNKVAKTQNHSCKNTFANLQQSIAKLQLKFKCGIRSFVRRCRLGARNYFHAPLIFLPFHIMFVMANCTCTASIVVRKLLSTVALIQ